MAVVFLFHTELLSFCGMSNPRMSPADRRLKPALHIFGRKPEEPAEPEPSQDISTMDERAVSHWLRTLSMDQYISRFEEEGICGLLLANLTEQDLQDIGIDKGLHRKKILMYRDKLQVEGVKALSVRDQWHLNRKYSVARVNGLPDPGVQRFAPAVLDHLKNQEMDVRASEERFIKHVDDLDADLLEQSLYLETLEAINHEEKDLRRLEGRQNRLEEQKGKYEKLKENYRDIGAQQRNETRNIRDWHIKRWWRSMWKEEMEVYEDQVKKDEEQRTSDEQKLDGKLEKIEKELMDIADQKKKRQESIAELKHKDSEKFWNNVLEAEGLLSAEAEVKEKDALLRVVEKQLLEAMKKTGVADPELAAHLITQHERSKILLSEATDRSTEVATNMQSWVSLAEEIVRDPSSATDCLPTALFILRDEHQEQMRRIRKFRPQFLQKIYDSVSAVIALSQPSSTNRTV
ncbi:SAM domain-containing protein [Durusdinium trenchii]|uniref:SAM domain-containing protein n=1 Tax=Durusdinium trenchii TaxID=1381693 RepID=A0ABP0N4F5_9DINO